MENGPHLTSLVTYGAPFLVQGHYDKIGGAILTLLISKEEIKSMSDMRILVEKCHGNIAQIN